MINPSGQFENKSLPKWHGDVLNTFIAVLLDRHAVTDEDIRVKN